MLPGIGQPVFQPIGPAGYREENNSDKLYGTYFFQCRCLTHKHKKLQPHL